MTIRVRGLPPALRNDPSGVATFDADSGADFVWTPIAGATQASDGSLLLHSTSHSAGLLSVTLASSRAFARHGYLVRTTARVPPSGGGEMLLDVKVANVRFEVPPGSRRAGPLRLSRLDDPHWMPMQHGTTGLILTRDAPVTVLLGAGQYELRDPIAPERRQHLEVPGSEVVVITAELATGQAGRP